MLNMMLSFSSDYFYFILFSRTIQRIDLMPLRKEDLMYWLAERGLLKPPLKLKDIKMALMLKLDQPSVPR